jgi:hypothetical protein
MSSSLANRPEEAMLRVLTTAFALVLLASNAIAQEGQGKGKMMQHEPDPEFKPLYNERNYKAATERIPDAKKSNDPWAGAREPAPDPAAAPARAATKPRTKQP